MANAFFSSSWRILEPYITGRNVWLRSMNVRLELEQGQVRLDIGDIFGLTEQMNASGPVAKWHQVLRAVRDNDIAGLETKRRFRLRQLEHGRSCLG
jgi:hypothetical protein